MPKSLVVFFDELCDNVNDRFVRDCVAVDAIGVSVWGSTPPVPSVSDVSHGDMHDVAFHSLERSDELHDFRQILNRLKCPLLVLTMMSLLQLLGSLRTRPLNCLTEPLDLLLGLSPIVPLPQKSQVFLILTPLTCPVLRKTLLLQDLGPVVGDERFNVPTMFIDGISFYSEENVQR